MGESRAPVWKKPMSLAPARLALVFEAARDEPDVDLMFLSNKEAATLGTACARGDTDFHVTGVAHAVGDLVTTKPMTITIELNPDTYGGGVYAAEEAEGHSTADLSDRMRLNLTTSREALGIDGTVGNTMMGQSSVPLLQVFRDGNASRSTVIDVSFMNWQAFACTVSISNPKLIDVVSGERIVAHFVTDEGMDRACARAQGALEEIYTMGSALRNVIVYELAPALSKSVMRVPYGIDCTSYDSVCNVVDRPTAMSDAAFESLAQACLEHTLAVDEVGDERVTMAEFLTATASPGVAASAFAGRVANTLSLLVGLVCPYRIDGRTMVMPDGLKMVGVESWKAESPRNLFSEDDCEGSGAIQTSLVYRAETIARDAVLAAKYPHIAGIANALVHHMVGVAVLAANAGQAESAGKNGHAAVAGHAIALAIPKLQALDAMVTGIKATGSVSKSVEHAQKSKALSESLTEPLADALYHDDDIHRMPADEALLLESAEGRRELSARLQARPLALEGTSPVASGKLYEPKPSMRVTQIEYAKAEKAIEARLGPTVTRAVARMHIPVDPSGPDHQFYKHFVEFSVPLRRYGTFQGQSMREGGVATAEWVLTDANNVQEAGVSPKDLDTGNYLLLPLWKLGAEAAAAIDVASAEVLQNTLPIRAGPVRLSAKQLSTYRKNIASLESLNTQKKVIFEANRHRAHASRHVVTFAALVGNESALPLFVEAVLGDSRLACRVAFTPVEAVLLDADGADIGQMPFIEILML